MNYPDKAQCSGSASALAQRIGRYEIGKNLQFSTLILINNFRKIGNSFTQDKTECFG
jgi:hypothetical protein